MQKWRYNLSWSGHPQDVLEVVLLLNLRNTVELHFVRNERILFLETLPWMTETIKQERKAGEITRALILMCISWIQLDLKLIFPLIYLFLSS